VNSIIDFVVNCRIISKPRMTRSDSWKIGKYNSTGDTSVIRPCVLQYIEFKELLKAYSIANKIQMETGQIIVGFNIRINYGNLNQDIDNIVKAIKDCLNGIMWVDDCLKYIRGYRYVTVDYMCDNCENTKIVTRGKNKGKVKTCGKWKECKKTGFEVKVWRNNNEE